LNDSTLAMPAMKRAVAAIRVALPRRHPNRRIENATSARELDEHQRHDDEDEADDAEEHE